MSRRWFGFEWRGLVLVGVVLAAGCARHEADMAFRRTVLIGDRGISVPLPPPSLIDAPKQDVDVHADALGDDPVLAGTVAHVDDAMGEGRDELELAADAQDFDFEGLPIDLTANCLEVWLAAPDGRESDHVLVHAEIVVADDVETIVTVLGCE